VIEKSLHVGDRFEGVLLETFVEKNASRPRVRPIEYFDRDIKVEFPRKLREENTIGTRFRGDLKVSQKTKDGIPYGQHYLVVTNNSIEKVEEYSPIIKLKAIKLNTVSDRGYKYIQEEFKKEPNLVSFGEFRDKAYANSKEIPEHYEKSSTISIKRSEIIKTYAISRARGKCEGCKNEAPFLKINGQPYLEVHHIDELSKGGSDSPINVIALCPNCHARVTHGKDGKEYNEKLRIIIINTESEIK
jgi:hypothetical protein